MNESGDRTPNGGQPQKISVTRHEKNLRELRCAVAMSRFITLHHCHAGSMRDLGPEFRGPGMGEKNNPFLQIPLEFKYHVGHLGIDSGYGVQSWELEFGTQMKHLQWVNDQLSYDIFEQAKLWSRENWKSSVPVVNHLD